MEIRCELIPPLGRMPNYCLCPSLTDQFGEHFGDDALSCSVFSSAVTSIITSIISASSAADEAEMMTLRQHTYLSTEDLILERLQSSCFKFPACAALRPSVDKSFVVEEMVSIPARTEQGKDW